MWAWQFCCKNPFPVLRFYGSTFQPPVGLLWTKQTFLRGVSCADFTNNDYNIEAGNSASTELHGPTGFLVFVQAKENMCVYGVSFATFFLIIQGLPYVNYSMEPALLNWRNNLKDEAATGILRWTTISMQEQYAEVLKYSV